MNLTHRLSKLEERCARIRQADRDCAFNEECLSIGVAPYIMRAVAQWLARQEYIGPKVEAS